jgi:predicted nucleic acid-binding protein
MLTDTTFWIDLLQERAGRTSESRPAYDFLARNRAYTLRVSMITWGELAEGFREAGGLDWLLRRVRVLALPRQIAWEASRIQRELGAQGLRLGENDCWIAATARAWGMPVVTRDEAFKRVPRLQLAAYA